MHVTRLQLVMHWVEILAVFSFAISGLAEAKRRRLDAVGAFIVAFLTAFGGGTLRDLLLDRRPVCGIFAGFSTACRIRYH